MIVETDVSGFYRTAFLPATKFDDLVGQAPPLNAIVNRIASPQVFTPPLHVNR